VLLDQFVGQLRIMERLDVLIGVADPIQPTLPNIA